MTSELMNGDVVKKKRFKNKWSLAIVVLEASLFFSSIAIFFSAVIVTKNNFDLGFRLAGIGGAVFGSMVGSIFVIIITGAIISAVKGRRGVDSSVTSLTDVARVPYTTSSYSGRASKKTQPYYCVYCGFKATRSDSKCPECGGPVKEGKD